MVEDCLVLALDSCLSLMHMPILLAIGKPEQRLCNTVHLSCCGGLLGPVAVVSR